MTTTSLPARRTATTTVVAEVRPPTAVRSRPVAKPLLSVPMFLGLFLMALVVVFMTGLFLSL